MISQHYTCVCSERSFSSAFLRFHVGLLLQAVLHSQPWHGRTKRFLQTSKTLLRRCLSKQWLTYLCAQYRQQAAVSWTSCTCNPQKDVRGHPCTAGRLRIWLRVGTLAQLEDSA